MIKQTIRSKTRRSESESLLEPSDHHQSQREPIAIIGLGCRFAGASSPQAFWDLLQNGVDATRDLPHGRFDLDAVYDPTPGTPGKIISRQGGFIDHVDEFDASFFGISPREAMRMDPQQRILLEVAWEALEDGGQVPAALAGTAGGVFIGACTSDYEDIQYFMRDREDIDMHVAAGTARAVLSGRLSYVLDLRGPSMTVDTACSSSLVAVHLACQSIWNGECSLALAGGVNLILLPELSMGFSRAKMLAPDSRCKFGDARADGFCRSDGVGVVVLKPLSLALAANDPIYALIRGTATNNDGQSSGTLATPSREGQEAVLRQAYRRAGVSPGAVRYVEAHGTGTSVGDPIEVQSLGTVLAEGRAPDAPCLIGSVKSNIGHTEGAAGIAGVIKLALCLKARAVPPSLHFAEANPEIPWAGLQLRVANDLTAFPDDERPIFAGISAFGISATNVHLVLEDYRKAAPSHEPVVRGDDHHLLTLSGHTPEALESLARSYRRFLGTSPATIEEICYTASSRRTHHEHRLAMVVRSREDAAEKLQAFLDCELRPEISAGRAAKCGPQKIAFVFPGHGAQWLGMGRELLAREPVFRASMEQCDQAIREHSGWSAIEELNADEGRSRLTDIDVAQPCIFAVQVALAELWRSWGVEPDAVIGQSMGEVAAAHVAGSLSLRSAARVICERSRLLKRISGLGSMAVLGLGLEDTARVLAGYEDRVSIAVSNGPRSTVISGDTEAIESIIELLRKSDLFCQAVKVDVASHSPQVECLTEDLLDSLKGMSCTSGSLPIYSTVTGSANPGLLLDEAYWVRNLREPVLFSAALERLLEDGHRIFLEVSPHPILQGPIQEALGRQEQPGRSVGSLRRDESEQSSMLASLGAIYAAGGPVDWKLTGADFRNCVQLPGYAWQRESYWLGPDSITRERDPWTAAQRGNRDSGFLQADAALRSAAHPGTHIWEFDVTTERFPFLADHCVQGAIVLPATAYIEMALEAAEAFFPGGSYLIENLTLEKALFLTEPGGRRMQLVVTPEGHRRASVQFFSSEPNGIDEAWTLHARGELRQIGSQRAPAANSLPESIQARCPEWLSQEEYYRELEERGLEYGPSFRGVKSLWRREREAIGRLEVPAWVKLEEGLYKIHPATLDVCFQVLAATVSESACDAGRATFLPVGLGSLKIHSSPSAASWSHAVLAESLEGAESLRGDVYILDELGQVLIEAQGLTMRRLEESAVNDGDRRVDELLYEVCWQPDPAREEQLEYATERRTDAWMIFSDATGVGQDLAHRLRSLGEYCVLVTFGESFAVLDSVSYQINPADPQDYSRLCETAIDSLGAQCLGIVHLSSLDLRSPEDVDKAYEVGCGSALLLLQALSRNGEGERRQLWLITRGAQPVSDDVAELSVAQSPLWGMGRAIACEHPELDCTLIDLDPDGETDNVSLLLNELLGEDQEDQIAFRQRSRFVARLVRRAEPRSTPVLTRTPDRENSTRLSDSTPFRLEITTPGCLDDLRARETTRRKPGPREIEINVHAAGLNFRDVMLAMGILPAMPEVVEELGYECAGRVVRVGEDVAGLRPGQEVMAIAPNCFGNYAIADASLVVEKPPSLSFEEAAALPISLLTAHYGLHGLARIKAGERVLIHAASGGVGLAALEVALRAGAEVFATAGTPEKRSFVRSKGVKHVFCSRTLSFVDEVRDVTGGEGVDIVLNSLSGEAIAAGISLLREGGRFIELGRTDIYNNAQLGLRPFHNNLALFALDVSRLARSQPEVVGSALRDALKEYVGDGKSPLPHQTFAISEVESAFRLMAQAGHTGKIVVSMRDEKLAVTRSTESAQLDSEATYLITGGLGGLGLKAAEWLIQQGARHLVLVGRSGPGASTQAALEAMRERSEVVVVKADVSRIDELQAVLSCVEREMPPLRGVVHAAGVLDDGILLHLDRERFETVTAPKIRGAWNLHEATLDSQLDFFVLFSSAASLLGSPGQANYSAANSFLDVLAHYRSGLGLPALSINWGRWTEVGLAAGADRGEWLAFRGLGGMQPETALDLFGRLLQESTPQVSVMDFDPGQWERSLPSARRSNFLAELNQPATGNAVRNREDENPSVKEEVLRAGDEAERQQLMESYLGARVARVLGFSPLRHSKLDANQPLNTMGLDSLMAVEMKAGIETDLGVRIPVVRFLRGLSLRELASQTIDEMLMPLFGSDLLRASLSASADDFETSLFGGELTRCDVSEHWEHWEEVSI